MSRVAAIAPCILRRWWEKVLCPSLKQLSALGRGHKKLKQPSFCVPSVRIRSWCHFPLKDKLRNKQLMPGLALPPAHLGLCWQQGPCCPAGHKRPGHDPPALYLLSHSRATGTTTPIRLRRNTSFLRLGHILQKPLDGIANPSRRFSLNNLISFWSLVLEVMGGGTAFWGALSLTSQTCCLSSSCAGW